MEYILLIALWGILLVNVLSFFRDRRDNDTVLECEVTSVDPFTFDYERLEDILHEAISRTPVPEFPKIPEFPKMPEFIQLPPLTMEPPPSVNGHPFLEEPRDKTTVVFNINGVPVKVFPKRKGLDRQDS